MGGRPITRATVEFRGPWGRHMVACAPGERLLCAGLRQGVALPYECATGTCGSCRARVVAGEVEHLWPEAPGARLLGGAPEGVLLCQSAPRGDCVVEVAAGASSSPAVARSSPDRYAGDIVEVVPEGEGLATVRVRLDRPMAFLPGQFALVSNGLVPGFRAYSMANCAPAADTLRFVVRHKEGGALSPWLSSGAAAGGRVHLFGPLGAAHLRPGEDGDLVAVVGGSGVAVALSLLEWAAQQDDAEGGRVWVVCGLRTTSAAGLLRELDDHVRRLGDRARLILALSEEPAGAAVPAGIEVRHGLVNDVAQERLAGTWGDKTVFVAGPPPMVRNTLRTLIAKARVHPGRIRYDSFT